MADTDPLAAALVPISERVAACNDGFSPDPLAFIRSAGDVPRLLSAVDKVLALHFMAPVQASCERCRCKASRDAG